MLHDAHVPHILAQCLCQLLQAIAVLLQCAHQHVDVIIGDLFFKQIFLAILLSLWKDVD